MHVTTGSDVLDLATDKHLTLSLKFLSSNIYWSLWSFALRDSRSSFRKEQFDFPRIHCVYGNYKDFKREIKIMAYVKRET